MEELKNIEQLNSCKNFIIINGEDVTEYEFICIHPHNDKFILALETYSMEGKKLYIPNLLGETVSHGEVYVGNFDSKFVASRMLEWAKGRVTYWEKRLKDLKNNNCNENN